MRTKIDYALKHRALVFSLLTLCLPLSSAAYDPNPYQNEPPAHIFSLETSSSYTLSDWRSFCEKTPCVNDFILLHDLTLLQGKLESIPSIPYTFGPVFFLPSELSLIVIFDKENEKKAQYITRTGESYIGSLPKTPLRFTEMRSNEADQVVREIHLRDIKAVWAAPQDDAHIVENSKLFTLEFKNGDQLPCTPVNEIIRLKAGYKEFTLPIQRIIEVNYNGGLQGKFKNGKGKTKRVPFSWVQDPHFCVLLKTNQIYKFPWENISSIQARNGGFKQDKIHSKKGLASVSKDEKRGFPIQQPSSFNLQPVGAQPLNENAALLNGNERRGSQSLASLVDMKTEFFQNKKKDFFLATDFDSPFHMAYHFEHVEEQEEADLVAMLTEEELIKINDMMLFESEKPFLYDPETFSIENTESEE